MSLEDHSFSASSNSHAFVKSQLNARAQAIKKMAYYKCETLNSAGHDNWLRVVDELGVNDLYAKGIPFFGSYLFPPEFHISAFGKFGNCIETHIPFSGIFECPIENLRRDFIVRGSCTIRCWWLQGGTSGPAIFLAGPKGSISVFTGGTGGGPNTLFQANITTYKPDRTVAHQIGTGSFLVPKSVLHHIVLVFKQSEHKLRLYVDNVMSEVSFPYAFTTGAYTSVVGSGLTLLHPGDTYGVTLPGAQFNALIFENPFTGAPPSKIDEIAVYAGRGWTTAEVAYDWNGGAGRAYPDIPDL